MSLADAVNEEITERYQVNIPFVVYETFADQETAIINLKTGNYYSLNVSGAKVWEKLASNVDVSQITMELESLHDGNPEFIHNCIQNFISNLRNEDLLVEFKETKEKIPPARAFEQVSEKTPFEPPIIEGYTDMQELLLLDPIHDVDETGFPNAKQA